MSFLFGAMWSKIPRFFKAFLLDGDVNEDSNTLDFFKSCNYGSKLIGYLSLSRCYLS